MFPNSLLALVLACSPAQEPDPVIPPQSPPPPHAGATANRLVHETSPYLLQHAYNPVDWHPWGEAALAMARAEDKPIFLSIGYSACHWCHVMERESFEDPEIAAFLKEHFIAIKVDREERPDLDDLYMNAVQRMTGQGGWPMSVFLTPDRKPFYGGTYFPPRAAHGRPGFLDLLQGIAEAWDTRRPELEDAANRLGDSLQIELPAAPATGLPAAPALRRLEASWVAAYRSTYDSVWGGFGSAPKFPRAEDLRWLLAVGAGGELVQAREMALFTLRKMAAGGMYDQIGGGFARYSVDAKWMVPHFEKMLYDQGTLIPAYLDAWRVSGDPEFARIARECCDYLLAERRDPSGGFWSATDADSEGEEGLFFVWTPAQLVETLGEERARFAATLYGVTEKGNFEQGASVLHHGASLAAAAAAAGLESGEPAAVAAEIRAALYAARAERVPPANDDKVIVAWNGLAIDALAHAGRALDELRYTEAAVAAAEFLLRELRDQGGRWQRTWRAGEARHAAVLEDHAYLCRAFLSLFQSTGDERWLAHAQTLADAMISGYWDEVSGVFYTTDGSDPDLLHRLQSPWDGATPAPNAVALESLVLLHAFDHDERWLNVAERGLAAGLALVESSNPRAFTATLLALHRAVDEARTAVVVGSGSRESLAGWRKALFSAGTPPLLTVFRAQADPDSDLPLFAGRAAAKGLATLYLCRGTSCLPPSIDPDELDALLAQ